MSKVAIQGNASGTGTFTIAAPNSNTDRTLTLPDEAGTVLTSASTVSGLTFNDDITITDGTATHTIGTDGFNNLTLYSDQSTSEYINYKGGIGHTFRVGDTSVTDTSGSEAMRIDSSGRLIIADTGTFGDTSAPLCISNRGSLGGAVSIGNDTDTSNLNCITFMNGNGQVGRIRTTSTATEYLTSSDYRLKENVVDMTNAVDRVKALKPSQFNFIADPNTTVDGFLAHEVQVVVPEAVAGDKDEVETVDVYDDEGNVISQEERPVYQGIDQSKLVPLLTGALQEAIARIETLEAEVATLKGASA